MESETTSEVAHTQYQQDVGEDTSDHTGLDDIDITLDQCDDGNQQFDDVTEWSDSVEESKSKAYPNVAFNKPPHASPSRKATSSVAKANPPASGRTLNRQATKMTTSDWPVLASAHAIGSKIGAAQMIGHPLTVF